MDFVVFQQHGAVMGHLNVGITVTRLIALSVALENSNVELDNALKAARSVMGLMIVMMGRMSPNAAGRKSLVVLD